MPRSCRGRKGDELGAAGIDWNITVKVGSTLFIGQFGNTIILFACSPKFCISIVFIFSWDHCKSLEKLETMLMQNLEGQKKSIMVFSELAYWRPRLCSYIIE